MTQMTDPTNELQILSLSNDTIYLTSGGFVVLPTDQVNDADDNPTNEIQTLSKSGSTISLTQGWKRYCLRWRLQCTNQYPYCTY
jgi:hypothetical protein